MPTINKKQLKPPKDKQIRYSKQTAQSYYNTSQWKKLRLAYFMEHPLCEYCLAEGKTVPTEEIHHIKPILSVEDDLQRKDLAFNPNNLVALCKDCHHKIHNHNLKKER